MNVWLLGAESPTNLAGSAFEKIVEGHLGGRPTEVDPQTARAIIALATRLAAEGRIPSMHDVSDGGLAVTIAEICIRSQIGARIDYSDWRHLFSEDPHRFVAVAAPEVEDSIVAAADEAGVTATRVGSLGGAMIEFVQDERVTAAISTESATSAWRGAI